MLHCIISSAIYTGGGGGVELYDLLLSYVCYLVLTFEFVPYTLSYMPIRQIADMYVHICVHFPRAF